MDTSSSTSDCKLKTLVVDTGTKLLRELFFSVLEEPTKKFFQKTRIQDSVRDLCEANIIDIEDSEKLLSPDVDASNFDIALLYTLLTTFFDKIRRPKNGWTSDPDPKDFSIGADLVRLKKVGDRILACDHKAISDDGEYVQKIRKEIKIVLLRIARNGLHNREQYFKEEIDRILADH